MYVYALSEMYDTQFEELVVYICEEILGCGTICFTDGPDGGRDAAFEGTAQNFPSKSSPASGKFIIQSKHCNRPDAKFSDSDFQGEGPNSILSKEIPRIKELVDDGECKHYMLFSNRRMPGALNSKLVKRVIKETGVSNVYFISLNMIEKWIKKYPGIIEAAGINLYFQPLRINPDDFAEIIVRISENVPDILKKRAALRDEYKITEVERKNEINGLSNGLFTLIRKEYRPFFEEIRNFLSIPENERINDRYKEAAADINAKLVAHSSDFGGNFDRALEYVCTHMIERDSDLARNKRLTRALIYFMYWFCDVGLTEEADAEAA